MFLELEKEVQDISLNANVGHLLIGLNRNSKSKY